jgi:hypothetical protein
MVGGGSEVFENVVHGFGGEAFALGVRHAFAHFYGWISIGTNAQRVELYL